MLKVGKAESKQGLLHNITPLKKVHYTFMTCFVKNNGNFENNNRKEIVVIEMNRCFVYYNSGFPWRSLNTMFSFRRIPAKKPQFSSIQVSAHFMTTHLLFKSNNKRCYPLHGLWSSHCYTQMNRWLRKLGTLHPVQHPDTNWSSEDCEVTRPGVLNDTTRVA